jgi:hypothetical protein
MASHMATFAFFDEQISALETKDYESPMQHEHGLTQIRALRTRRNELAPLLRLPADVLRDIVHIMVVTEHRPATLDDLAICRRPQWPFGESTKWTRIMATCTRLRSLCLAERRLWSYFDIDRNVEWLQLCMQRAATIPVTLHFDESTACIAPGSLKDRESIVASLLLRARHLWLVVRNGDDQTADMNFDAPPDGSMIHLRTLRCVCSSPQEVALGTEMLIGNAAVLTEVTMVGVFLMEDVPHFNELTRLELARVRFDHQSSRLRNLLKNTPRLKFLSLHIVEIDGADLTPCQPIVMPDLLELELKDFPSALVALLRLLPIPRFRCKIDSLMRTGDWLGVTSTPSRAELHDETLSLLPRLFALTVDSMYPLIGSLGALLDGPPSYEHRQAYQLALTPCETVGEQMQLVEHSPSVGALSHVLAKIKNLRVHGTHMCALFDQAAKEPTLLANIEDLAIRHGEVGEPEMEAFKKWLHAHAEAGYRPPNVDFQDCVNRLQQHDSVTSLCHGVIDEGLIRSVLKDGVIVNFNPSSMDNDGLGV